MQNVQKEAKRQLVLSPVLDDGTVVYSQKFGLFHVFESSSHVSSCLSQVTMNDVIAAERVFGTLGHIAATETPRCRLLLLLEESRWEFDVDLMMRLNNYSLMTGVCTVLSNICCLFRYAKNVLAAYMRVGYFTCMCVSSISGVNIFVCCCSCETARHNLTQRSQRNQTLCLRARAGTWHFKTNIPLSHQPEVLEVYHS